MNREPPVVDISLRMRANWPMYNGVRLVNCKSLEPGTVIAMSDLASVLVREPEKIPEDVLMQAITFFEIRYGCMPICVLLEKSWFADYLEKLPAPSRLLWHGADIVDAIRRLP